MPEYRESLIAGETIRHFLSSQPLGSLAVLNLWIDPTDKEVKKAPKTSCASRGYVYIMDDASKVKRGQLNSQKQVYPSAFANSGLPISQCGLCLVDVEFSARNVILNLDRQWLQIQLFTHTCAQIYTRVDWEQGICCVDNWKRGFKIGLAIEFQDYVLAFTTMDNIIAAHWSLTRSGLPAQHPDVFTEFHAFLVGLVGWMKSREGKNRDRPAMTVVRQASDIFPGVGVYSVCEIFNKAALSPSLTEDEVFTSASRTARLCYAFYQFAAEAHANLWTFVKRCLHGYTLAADINQRMKYTDQLDVWGKQCMQLLPRMHTLLEKFEVQLFSALFYPDVS
ncbi:hypothetical protein BV22DRAFT_721541 [Leucogyrophana mollusca]|uniref:Uncharacterized protein n=1 Tax=Leucogyrophana mollusca TaxID=85980 RepID=A0ACB8B9G0_9AGAM|nr:hypothetical protein BV22DRAFT_721541 [Leucogyrophana mollusca]